jgi:glucosamine-6-phosphate deaminase
MVDLDNLKMSGNLVKQWQVDELSVLVYESPELMVKNVALSVQQYLQQCLTERGSANIILATGNSQIQFLENLIKLGELDWSKITCFHLDEFLGISGEHPGSFRKYLQQRVASKVNLQAFHYIQGDTLEPIAECDRYARLLQAQAIDLCCLGIGENGHIAFNEPEVAQLNDTRWVKIVKLAESTLKQQVNGIYFSSLETVPTYAFTLTIPAIFHARKIICLAAGKSKSSVIKSVLENPIDVKFPASLLRTQPQAALFTDREAADVRGN